MSVERENAKNEQYVFRYNDGDLSDVITYKKHLINSIKNDSNSRANEEIQNFSSDCVNDDKFKRFIELAKSAEYTVYKIYEL